MAPSFIYAYLWFIRRCVGVNSSPWSGLPGSGFLYVHQQASCASQRHQGSSECPWNKWEQTAATRSLPGGIHVCVQSRRLYLSQPLKCPSLAVLRNNSSSHPKADPCTRGAESLFSSADNGESQRWPELLLVSSVSHLKRGRSASFLVSSLDYPGTLQSFIGFILAEFPWGGGEASPPIRANSGSLSRRQVLCGTPRKTVSIQMLKPNPFKT